MADGNPYLPSWLAPAAPTQAPAQPSGFWPATGNEPLDWQGYDGPEQEEPELRPFGSYCEYCKENFEPGDVVKEHFEGVYVQSPRSGEMVVETFSTSRTPGTLPIRVHDLCFAHYVLETLDERNELPDLVMEIYRDGEGGVYCAGCDAKLAGRSS